MGEQIYSIQHIIRFVSLENEIYTAAVVVVIVVDVVVLTRLAH